MSTKVNDEHHFPLGEPVNRKQPAGPPPIPGRPHWFLKPDGTPYYVEPPAPPLPDITLCLSPAIRWMVDRLESVQPAAPAAQPRK